MSEISPSMAAHIQAYHTRRLLEHEPTTVTSGASVVFDVRGFSGFRVFLSGGTATYRECTAAGVPIPGSSASVAANGTAVPQQGPYYLISAATAACVVVLY